MSNNITGSIPQYKLSSGIGVQNHCLAAAIGRGNLDMPDIAVRLLPQLFPLGIETADTSVAVKSDNHRF